MTRKPIWPYLVVGLLSFILCQSFYAYYQLATQAVPFMGILRVNWLLENWSLVSLRLSFEPDALMAGFIAFGLPLLVYHVTDGEQFQNLEERFNNKIEETHQELQTLDKRLAYYHKVEGALLAIAQTPENSLPAMQLLDELGLPKDIAISDIRQTIQQFEIEKDALQEFFDDTLKTYTTYQEMKDQIKSCEVNIHKQETEEKSL